MFCAGYADNERGPVGGWRWGISPYFHIVPRTMRTTNTLDWVLWCVIACSAFQTARGQSTESVKIVEARAAKLSPSSTLPKDSLSAADSLSEVPTGNGSYLAPSPHLAEADQFPIPIRVGYDGGFIIASKQDLPLNTDSYPYRLKINGWGQLRNTVFNSANSSPDLNQLQLKRARLIFSGNAFSSDLTYFVQFDGRSNSSDGIRILDYYCDYDLAHNVWDCTPGTLGVKVGLYKMPFSLARQLSGKELEFADRSMSSIYFDVNRSLGAGLYGVTNSLPLPIHWELAMFNGLVTGGAETGSSGTLDNNNAFSGRMFLYPSGDWGPGQLADFRIHQSLASRVGAAFAVTTIDRAGSTEFASLRTVDSGRQLSTLLPSDVESYSVAQYSLDASLKFRGYSVTGEYYFRNVNGFRGTSTYISDLFDHGFWLQCGKFVIPRKLELLSRWSRVTGSSGTLGATDLSSDEIAAGSVWYFHEQNLKLTTDATYLNGAAINSSALDIDAGNMGWLFRAQFQFSF